MIQKSREFLPYILVIILINFLIFYKSLFNGFVHDDGFQVLNNPVVHASNPVRQIFSTEVWEYYGARKLKSYYYRPIHILTHYLTRLAFDFSNVSFHLVNLIIHIFVCGLFFILLNLILKESRISLLATLLFALHPVNSQSVMWIAAITDPLCAFFLLISGICYLRYLQGEHTSSLYSLLGGFSFLLALLSKETGIVFLFILFLAVILFPAVNKKRVLKLGFHLGLYLLLYFSLRHLALDRFSFHSKVRDISLVLFIKNSLVYFLLYSYKLFIPIPLNTYYHNYLETLSLKDYLASGITFLIILFIVYRYIIKKRDKYILISGLWFFSFIAPSFVLMLTNDIWFNERYLYIPTLGAAFTLAYILKVREKDSHSNRLIYIGIIVLIILFGILTYNRTGVWKNDVTFWEDAYKNNPESAKNARHLALAYIDSHAYKKAERLLINLSKDYPDDEKVSLNLMNLYYDQGEYQRVFNIYNHFIKENSPTSEMLNVIGVLAAKCGKREEAAAYFIKAMQEKDNFASLSNLANLYILQNKYDKAIRLLEDNLQFALNNYKIYYLLGQAYFKKGMVKKSLDYYLLAINYKKNDSRLYLGLAKAYSTLGDMDKANYYTEQGKKVLPTNNNDVLG
ncbi:MAG: hypothetical protein V1872_12875 [bacterium]